MRRVTLFASVLLAALAFGDEGVRVSPFPVGTSAPAPAITESKPAPRVATNATSASHDCGTGCWTTGTFRYDAAGNISSMGSETYRYDGVHRLAVATLLPPDGATVTARYTYDPFGNFHRVSLSSSLSGLSGMAFSIDRTSNRVSGNTYDAAGNVTWESSTGATMQWDGVGMMARYAGSRRTSYIYTVDDERIATFELASGGSPTRATWTIRGTGNQVLRMFESAGGAIATDSWSWTKDYVRGPAGKLIASQGTEGIRHFHPDHLGSPRLITDEAGVKTAEHAYAPFGSELTDRSQDTESLKFTGHERDLMGSTGLQDLDYMHRRFYSVTGSRFLSVDPVLAVSRSMQSPQGWNRYSYVQNNPVTRVDPDGRLDGNSDDMARQLFPNDRAAQLAFDQEVAEGTAKLSAAFLLALVPGPEDVPLALVGATKGFRAAARVFGRLFGAADELPSAGSIRNVNPTGSDTNCVNCAATVDNMLKTGRQASALPSEPKSIATLGTNWVSMGSSGNVAATMSKAGNGAMGIVYAGTGKPGSVGHVFNVVNQNGVVRFLDGQTGKAVQWRKEWTDIRLLRTN